MHHGAYERGMAIAEEDNGIVKLVSSDAAGDGRQQAVAQPRPRATTTQVDHEIGAYHNNR